MTKKYNDNEIIKIECDISTFYPIKDGKFDFSSKISDETIMQNELRLLELMMKNQILEVTNGEM